MADNPSLLSEKMKSYKAQGGYCKIPMNAEIKEALLKSGMKVDKMQNSAYVPKWVKNAIEAYTKSGGFAGLTLQEFLASMRPD